MDVDHYPEHVRRVDQLIASGEAGQKVAKEIAEDQKVSPNLYMCTYYNPRMYATLLASKYK